LSPNLNPNTSLGWELIWWVRPDQGFVLEVEDSLPRGRTLRLVHRIGMREEMRLQVTERILVAVPPSPFFFLACFRRVRGANLFGFEFSLLLSSIG